MSFILDQYGKSQLFTLAEIVANRDHEVALVADMPDFGYDISLEALAPVPRPVSVFAPHLLDETPRDTALWPSLFQLFPGWHWGIQPTGDCTRWGKQHGLDVLHACLWVSQLIAKVAAQVAGESVYGLAKCELVNSYRYHGAGSSSWAVSTATMKHGYLLRQRYEVGGKVWDLTHDNGNGHKNTYSVEWGNQGRGLPNELEPLASQHKTTDRLNPQSARGGQADPSGLPRGLLRASSLAASP